MKKIVRTRKDKYRIDVNGKIGFSKLLEINNRLFIIIRIKTS